MIEQNRISLIGPTALKTSRDYLRLLSVLESHGFRPQKWSLQERGGLPYESAEAVVEAVSSGGSSNLYLKRSIAPQFRLDLHGGGTLYMSSALSAKHQASFWEMSENVGALMEPDIGYVECPPIEPVRMPDPVAWANDLVARETYIVRLLGAALLKHGFIGLGVRTFLGARMVQAIGREHLLSLPRVIVSDYGKGSIRVDVSTAPWEMTLPEFHEVRSAAMHHLRKSGVLSTAKASTWAGRARLEWTKGPNFVDPCA
jgi:hypothetical protein